MKYQRYLRGTTGVSTALLVGLVSIVALVAVQNTGESANSLFTDVARTVANDVAGGRRDLPGNDEPSFTGGSGNLSVTEDAGLQSLDSLLTANDPDQGQTLTWIVTGGPSNGTLNGLPTSAGTGLGGNQTPSGVTYQPSAGYAGSDSISVQVSDGAETDSKTISITVLEVNDQPSVALVGNQTAQAGDGTVTVSNFASSFNPGDPNESGQAVLDYIVSEASDSNNVVSNVDIDNAGTLSFDVHASNTGTATINVQVQDDGGTANGGVDTSNVQSFDITVNGSGGYALAQINTSNGGGNKRLAFVALPAGTTISSNAQYKSYCESQGFSENLNSGTAADYTNANMRSTSTYYCTNHCCYLGQGNSRATHIVTFENHGLPLNTGLRVRDRGCGNYSNSTFNDGQNTTDRLTVTGGASFTYNNNMYDAGWGVGQRDFARSSPDVFTEDAVIVCQEP